MPPALPRPPISTWALIDDRIAELLGGLHRLGTVLAGRPSGTGTPCFAKSCLPWYSRRSIERLGCPAALQPAPAGGAGPYRNARSHGHFPKDVQFVTFDCYGTLIDWESGVYDAFQKEADRDGFTIDRDVLIPRFIDVQREIQRGSYELYAEVLRRTAVRVAAELGWELEPSRSNFLPNSVPAWAPFRETNAQLERFAKKYEIGILSNIDDKLLGATRRHFRVRLRPGGHRPAGAQLQARPGSLQGVRAPDREAEEALGAHRVRLPDRRGAVPQAEDPRDLGEPPRRGARAGSKKPTRRSRPSATPASCSTPPRPPERARGLRPPATRSSSPAGCGRPTRSALRAGERGHADRLALLPGRARAAAGAARPGRASSPTRCSPPTPTSTTCSAGSRSPGWRWAWASRPWSASTREPGAAQRELRDDDDRVLRRAARRRSRSGRCRRCRCPGTWSSATRSSSCTPPTGTRPTAWRSSRAGAACSCWATTCPTWRSR